VKFIATEKNKVFFFGCTQSANVAICDDAYKALTA
jgi:hypothetical protein